MRDPEIGDKIDQYQLTELLARGGMASLFKAIDVAGRLVVLKIPHIQYESDVAFFERFRREEQIGNSLDHPNIVKVLAPCEKSRMYMAMEYVEGNPLSTRLHAKTPLDPGEALEIARQACDALVHMHSRGVLHRDLKPENILITKSGQVKILDFGIARDASARRLTWAGLSHAIGTPEYMAPEQIRGRRGDARTDVYALGTLLYEMLTGRLPYASPDSATLLAAKKAEEARPPSEHVPGFDPALETILLKAIERSPDDRYASAAELLADLRDPSAVRSRDRSARSARGNGAIRARRRITLSLAIAAILTGMASLVWLSHSHSSAMVKPPARVAEPPARERSQ